MQQHKYTTHLTWHPMDKDFNYKEYSRLYTIRSKGKPDLVGTAAPEYQGSKYHYNPEDMLIMSLSACHMLSYLAYASNSNVKVLSYHDDAEGKLHQEGSIIKFEQVILRPKVLISKESNIERAESLHEKAHGACFIANSVNFPIKITPEVDAGDLPLISVA